MAKDYLEPMLWLLEISYLIIGWLQITYLNIFIYNFDSWETSYLWTEILVFDIFHWSLGKVLMILLSKIFKKNFLITTSSRLTEIQLPLSILREIPFILSRLSPQWFWLTLVKLPQTMLKDLFMMLLLQLPVKIIVIVNSIIWFIRVHC